ncbi:hypothetical protein D5086_011591 [Populus alba]|uniref:Uncharacterized protein n=1 Tax=Populus alba TaxID=43335 RepID=A0ACC4CDY6_POPAL
MEVMESCFFKRNSLLIFVLGRSTIEHAWIFLMKGIEGPPLVEKASKIIFGLSKSQPSPHNGLKDKSKGTSASPQAPHFGILHRKNKASLNDVGIALCWLHFYAL